MKRLILASSSPSRKSILEQAGVDFEADPSSYDEDMTIDLAPAELAKLLSMGKAKDVVARHKNAVVLGADSFGVFEGNLLGKPHTLVKARQMLQMLSGNWHEFITGFTIIDSDSGKTFSDSVTTKLLFKQLTSDEIDRYLAKEDVLELAGAYSIQTLGAVMVKRIEGSYSNVYGLPIFEVAEALKNFGIDFL